LKQQDNSGHPSKKVARPRGNPLVSKEPQNKNGKLRLILNNVLFVVAILFVLSIVAGRFGFDPLGIIAGIHLFSDNYPLLFFIVLLAYLSFAISKHWVAYKKTRQERDLGWAIILSIMAAIGAIAFVIAFFD